MKQSSVFGLFIFLNCFGNITASAQKENASHFLQKSREYYHIRPDSVLYFGIKALEAAKADKDAERMADAFNVIGVAHQDLGNISEARQNFEKGIRIADSLKLTQVQSGLLINLGLVEEGSGNYVSAMQLFLDALKLKEQLDDSLGIARCLNNIAQLYSHQGKHEDALDYFKQSLEIKIKYGNDISTAHSYNNIGVTYNELKQFDKAIESFHKAIWYYRKGNSLNEVSAALGNMGLTYDMMGDKKTALSYYLESLKERNESGSTLPAATLLINTGSLYTDIGDYKKAESYLKQGLSEGIELMSKEDTREAYMHLAELFAKQGKFKDALDMQLKYQAVSDSILNEQSSAALSEMQVKYETEKTDEQNKLLLKENEIQRITLERNRYITYGLAISAILILMIAYLVIRQTRLASRQKSIELEQKVLRSQMNPHFIFNSLQSIQAFIFQSNALDAGKYLADFSRLIRLILENSRNEFITLEKEIETLNYYLILQKLRFASRLDYTLDIDPGIDTAGYMVPPMLLQPFIENAIEHGIRHREEGGLVIINISRKGDYFNFVVTDNGVGRNHKASANGRHVSMATSITNERLELINSRSRQKIKMNILDLVSPTGTKVTFEIPLRQTA